MNTHKEITEQRYYDILEVLPPIYIGYIDGEPIHDGIACSEPYCIGVLSNVFTVCYKKEGKYYETLAEVFSSENKPIWNTYEYMFSRGNIAKTFNNEQQKIAEFVEKTKLKRSDITNADLSEFIEKTKIPYYEEIKKNNQTF